MSESFTKQLHPTGRPSYRLSNSFTSMTKSKKNKNNDSSCSDTSFNSNNGSNGDYSINQSREFNRNVIPTHSTPFLDKTRSFSKQDLTNKSDLNNADSEEEEEATKDAISTTNNYFNYKAMFLVILLCSIVASCLVTNTISKTNINIKELKDKFPNQPNETWLHFETVIDDILRIKPTHPAVFLLLYTKANNVKDLIQHLGNYASAKLETNENFIYVNKDEFHSNDAIQDYGYLIDKYEEDLIKKKVMVVEDLQEIPGQVAQAFHTLCDEITPLVDKVVYIFTLKVDSLNGKSEKIAETYLKKFWNDLDNDKLMPLITRVTSTVIKIVN